VPVMRANMGSFYCHAVLDTASPCKKTAGQARNDG
jgi:hypothetical protein